MEYNYRDILRFIVNRRYLINQLRRKARRSNDDILIAAIIIELMMLREELDQLVRIKELMLELGENH